MLVTTKRISRPFVVASIRAQARRSVFRLVAGLGKATQAGLVVKRPAGANVVGGLIDQAVEHRVTGQAKDKVDAVLVAPLHDLGAAVMAVAPNGDPGLWPVPSDAADETAQVTAHFDPRGGFAGTQQHGDRSACRRVVDVDRQKAALVVMGIE